MKCSRSLITLAVVALLVAPQVAAAQGKKKKKSNRTNVRATGVIKGISRAVMLMESDDGDRYYVRSSGGRGRRGRSGFSYTAKADPSWLHPGLMVQFRGKVTKKGKIFDEITEVVVFTPSAEKKPGIKQEISSATSKLFRDVPDDSAKKKVKKGKKKARSRRSRNVPTTPYLIAGKLIRYKNGEMTVVAPGVTLKAKVAENAKITVDVATPVWIRVGDKVSITGYYVGDKKQYVTASRIAVESQDTLVSKKKARARKRKKTRRPTRRRKPTLKKPAKKAADKDDS